jgi:hypothetical protein
MSSDRIKYQVASQTKLWSVLGCLQQPGQLSNQLQNSMRVNINPFIKSSGILTVPAAETESVGLHRLRVAATAEQGRPTCLPAGRRTDALFFARHLDYFIMTQNLTSVYRDLVPS